MFVNTIAYIYPGIHKSGVGVVRVEDGKVSNVVVGSIENDIVGTLLEKIKPTELVASSTKFHSRDHTKIPVAKSVQKFTVAKPGWEKSQITLFLDGTRHHGAYVHNVYKMLFRDLLRRRVVIRGWNIERFTREWALSNAPKEFGNV